VTGNPLRLDVAIAVVIAALVLIFAPGLAVVAMIVLVALVVCAIALVRDRLRAWRAPRGRARRSRNSR
jgi:ABC-type bacteriocin/lantibiotic exporter with double-glycine peptidase domain